MKVTSVLSGMRNRFASLVPLIAAVNLVACGDSESDGSGGGESGLPDSAIQSFEGLYALDAFTENPTACDAEGPSTLASKTEQFFVMVGASAFGQKYLTLASCEEMSCGDTVRAIRELDIYSPEYHVTLSEAVGPDALSGFVAMSGFLTDGACTEREYRTHDLTRTGNTIRVETRTIPLADEPPEDGVCWARPAQQRNEAEGRPCAALDTFGGTKLGPLP